MQPTGEPQPQPIRAGDRDRDAVVQRLQEAFAEGRLDDDEFDSRTRAALTATLDTDLAVLTRDLPDRTVAAPAAVTTVFAIAYKSRMDVLVPLGVRVDLEGFGVSKGWSAEEDLESRLPADAPVVHIRGIGYKGTIEVSTKPRQ